MARADLPNRDDYRALSRHIVTGREMSRRVGQTGLMADVDAVIVERVRASFARQGAMAR